MSIIITQPTANQTPAPGLGGNTVTTPTNTGHATTSDSGTSNRSCRWSGFGAVGGQIISVRLKADHSTNGFISGFGGASSFFNLEYSLNGGGSWISAFSRLNSTSLQNGSIDIALPNNQDLTQVQVRDQGTTSIFDPETENAGIDFSVSNIKIEVTTADGGVIVLM
jgi:hypothetical protein